MSRLGNLSTDELHQLREIAKMAVQDFAGIRGGIPALEPLVPEGEDGRTLLMNYVLLSSDRSPRSVQLDLADAIAERGAKNR